MLRWGVSHVFQIHISVDSSQLSLVIFPYYIYSAVSSSSLENSKGGDWGLVTMAKIFLSVTFLISRQG
jgi:hypothetical protein